MMKSLILRLLVAVGIAFCLSHSAMADNAVKSETEHSVSKRHALLIGISRYQDSAIKEVNDADNHVSEMKNCLMALGYDAKQIVVMISKEKKESVHYGNTANILKAASRIL